MKNPFFLSFFILLGACRDFNPETNHATDYSWINQSPAIVTSVEFIENPTIKDIYNQENSYIYTLVVDTSSNEDLLRKKMYKLHKKLNIPFVTTKQDREKFMLENRLSSLEAFEYKSSNDNINQTWRDSWGSDSYYRIKIFCYLSLNPFVKLNNSCESNKTIALIGGVFNSKKLADSALNILKREETQSFLVTQRGSTFTTYETRTE